MTKGALNKCYRRATRRTESLESWGKNLPPKGRVSSLQTDRVRKYSERRVDQVLAYQKKATAIHTEKGPGRNPQAWTRKKNVPSINERSRHHTTIDENKWRFLEEKVKIPQTGKGGG